MALPRLSPPSTANMVLASQDAVALDAVAANVIRIDPMDVEMVSIAYGRGLGDIDPRTVGNARGASLKVKKSLYGRLLPYWEDAWTNTRLNPLAHPFAKRLYGTDVPSLKEVRKEMDAIDASRIGMVSKCAECGLCVGACPTKNITLNDHRPVLGSKCIKCFICVEICPNGALGIIRK